MLDLAVLQPVVLLLLMLLLGRFERWLDDSTLPPPTGADRRRRRTPRYVKSPSSVAVRPGRRALALRAITRPRRRAGAVAVPSEPVPVPQAGRRHLLGGRLRHGDP